MHFYYIPKEKECKDIHKIEKKDSLNIGKGVNYSFLLMAGTLVRKPGHLTIDPPPFSDNKIAHKVKKSVPETELNE